jgi:hypothetical protein
MEEKIFTINNKFIDNDNLFNILKCIDHKTLLKLKLVSKQFNETINKIRDSINVIQIRYIFENKMYLHVYKYENEIKEHIKDKKFYLTYEYFINDIMLVKYLFNNGLTDFDTFLHTASCENAIETVKLMLNKGTYDLKNLNGCLMSASMRNYYEICVLLINEGARDLKIALTYSIENGNLKLYTFITYKLSKPYKINLKIACTDKTSLFVKLAIDLGCNDFNDGLHAAIHSNVLENVKLMIKCGATNNEDIFNYACKCCISGKIVELLYDDKYNLNRSLKKAVKCESFEVCEFLIKKGANNFNEALLKWDTEWSGSDIAKLLILSGADNYNEFICNNNVDHYDLFLFMLDYAVNYDVMLINVCNNWTFMDNQDTEIIWKLLNKGAFSSDQYNKKENWKKIMDIVTIEKDNKLYDLCKKYME